MKMQMKKCTPYMAVAVVLNLILFLLLLPMLYCSLADYATGDDLTNGYVAYHVLLDGGGVGDMLRAVGGYIGEMYQTWQGTWSSLVLFCFAPMIWGAEVYHIVPWIGIFTVLAGTWLLLREFLVKRAGLSKPLFWSLFALAGIFETQYAPAPRAGFFWYTCVAHYNIPFFVMAWTLTAALHFTLDVEKERVSSVRRSAFRLFWITIGYTYLGGTTYPAILLSLFCTFLLILYVFRDGKRRKQDVLCEQEEQDVLRKQVEWASLRKKRGLLLLLPLLLETVGLLISMAAPGNRVRGGAGFRFSPQNILVAVLQTIWQVLMDSAQNFLRVRPLILLIPFVVVLTLCAMKKREKKVFRHTLLMVLLAYLMNAAVYLPAVFAGTSVSGGYPDMEYFVFLITLILTTVYLTGYCVERRWDGEVCVEGKKKTGAVFAVLLILFLTAFYRHLIGNSMDYLCISYIRSGEMADFRVQMQERLAILEDPQIQDAVLEPMNDDQGPIMVFPPSADPEHIWNRLMARYYRKHSVVVKE